MTYFVVCGMAGAVLALFGIHVWEIVNDLEDVGSGFPGTSDVVAAGSDALLRACGGLAALTLVAYLLAPKARETSAPISN